ncbi:hypothetical protein DFS33DRAFT_1381115 [Desarmillaria ectypa]|nr:hypothetical protein DFS33DRAFT_1381115 [Desarmillaria ectypa]
MFHLEIAKSTDFCHEATKQRFTDLYPEEFTTAEQLKALFVDDPQVVNQLNAACCKVPFSLYAIRRHPEIYPRYSPPALHSYMTSGIERTHSTVDKPWEEMSNAYNPSASIISSFGTAKSRCVDVTAEQLFCLPINIKETVEAGAGQPIAYPPSDDMVRDYLVPNNEHEESVLIRKYVAFLTALFNHTVKTLTPMKSLEKETYSTAEELALSWKKRLASVRACLGISMQISPDYLSPAARKLEARLVESFMKIPFVVPQHREYMVAGYPSEPILVEAASQIMKNYHLEESAPAVLSEAQSESFLAKGERGELVGRSLIILAQRRAIQTLLRMKTPERDSILFAHAYPVPILLILDCMFHPEWQKTILNARPVGDENGPTFREAFKDVYVNFSHFVQAGDHQVIQHLPHMMLRFLIYSCSVNHASIDCITAMQLGVTDAAKHCVASAPVIPESRDAVYQVLLRSRTFMDEFTRMAEEADLSAFYTQKPAFFADKVESWSWLQDGLKTAADIGNTLDADKDGDSEMYPAEGS